MSNGLSTAFGTLLLLALLFGLAALLALALLGSVTFRRLQSRVPWALRSLTVALLVGVVGTGGFGVVALSDEDPVAAALFLALVFLPLFAAGFTLRRTTDLDWLDVLASVALAWCLPFVLGVGLFFGVVVGVEPLFGLEHGAGWRRRPVAVAASGLVAVSCAALLGTRVAEVVSPRSTS